jgi:hypothetical protein
MKTTSVQHEGKVIGTIRQSGRNFMARHVLDDNERRFSTAKAAENHIRKNHMSAFPEVKEEVELNEVLSRVEGMVANMLTKVTSHMVKKEDMRDFHIDLSRDMISKHLGFNHPKAKDIQAEHRKLAGAAEYYDSSDADARKKLASNISKLGEHIKAAKKNINEEIDLVEGMSDQEHENEYRTLFTQISKMAPTKTGHKSKEGLALRNKANKHLSSISDTHLDKMGMKKLPNGAVVRKNNMNEQVLELIDAIQSGSSEAIESSFNAIMSEKMINAIEDKKSEVASNLFNSGEE